MALVGGATLLALTLAFGAWQAVRTYLAWNRIERVEFDTAEARELIKDLAPATATDTAESAPVEVSYQGPVGDRLRRTSARRAGPSGRGLRRRGPPLPGAQQWRGSGTGFPEIIGH